MDVWFQGATAAVANVPAEKVIDEDGTLVPAMQELESTLLRLRGDMLDVVRKLEEMDGRRTGLIRDAFRLVAQVNADVFESVQAYKWAVLEHDADADIVARRTSATFTSVEDLIASLKS